MFEERHPLPEYDPRPLKVFISSVVWEFENERARVVALIEDLQMTPLYCEDPFEDGNRQQPIPVCMGMVRDADVVIFFFGADYAGRSIPESVLSTTEREYDRAIESGKWCLYFLKKNVTEVHPRMVRLRRKVADSHWCRFFGDIDELITKAHIDLAKVKNEWDFSKEEKPGWAFIRQLIEHYSDQDMSDEQALEGRKMLPQILGLANLPTIPGFVIKDLVFREEAAFADLEYELEHERISREYFNTVKEMRETDVKKRNFLTCWPLVRDLLRFSSGVQIHSCDMNGPLRDWLARCFGGIFMVRSLHIGFPDDKSSRLKKAPED